MGSAVVAQEAAGTDVWGEAVKHPLVSQEHVSTCVMKVDLTEHRQLPGHRMPGDVSKLCPHRLALLSTIFRGPN